MRCGDGDDSGRRPDLRRVRPISIVSNAPSRRLPRVRGFLLLLVLDITVRPAWSSERDEPKRRATTGVELSVPRMTVDVDGAPNAYGPAGLPTLDYERNAHAGGHASGRVVGYLTEKDGRTPLRQGPHDPCPGYYISTTELRDETIESDRDTRKYLDARHVSYVVLGSFAKRHGVQVGDLAAVHSARTRRIVFAIVGDSGNAAGSEGSLALLQHLGYRFKDGKEYAVEHREITIRYFAGSNRRRVFPRTQAQIDAVARAEGLDGRF